MVLVSCKSKGNKRERCAKNTESTKRHGCAKCTSRFRRINPNHFQNQQDRGAWRWCADREPPLPVSAVLLCHRRAKSIDIV